MKRTLLTVIIGVIALALWFSCSEYDPTGTGTNVDTTDIDSLSVPKNLRVDSLVVVYSQVVDSQGTIIDSSTRGRFFARWDSTLWATHYRVFLYKNQITVPAVYLTKVNSISFDSLAPNASYAMRVQALRFVADTIESDTSPVSVTVNLFLPASPEQVQVSSNGFTARVGWSSTFVDPNCIGYLVYLRDKEGNKLDSLFINDSLPSVAYFKVTPDNIYKVNVVTITTIGVSPICSLYTYDPTSTLSAGFALPYVYLSTFPTPPVEDAGSTIMGADYMVGVPGGIFVMGTIWPNPPGSNNGLPAHEAAVTSFYCGRTEISNGIFVKFVNDCDWIQETLDSAGGTLFVLYHEDTIAGPIRDFVKDSISGLYSVAQGKNGFPVATVRWIGAALFCNWLSLKDGITPCYDTTDWSLVASTDGYRLPTEAEFEYIHSAAMLGTKQRYPWGYADNPLLYGSTATGLTTIAHFNGYSGFFDLSGNLLEWCHDLSDNAAENDSSSYYQSLATMDSVVIDPQGPSIGTEHLRRGGSYRSEGSACSAVWRHSTATKDFTDIGFRVARRYVY